ncbi:MAG: CehA/McbA family metallohydrolase [Planctomycetota bacterium]|nr:CehA/McbA family metallohydrolase [Planctomycetota bacterium]
MKSMLPSVKRILLLAAIAMVAISSSEWTLTADDKSKPALAIVDKVEAQPLVAQVKRVRNALRFLGAPLTKEQNQALKKALEIEDDAEQVLAIQAVLDPLCIAGVQFNADGHVVATAGTAKPELVQQGWTVFLVKVNNQAGATEQMRVRSPDSAPVFKQSSGSSDPKVDIDADQIAKRWMEVKFYNNQPLMQKLSGLNLEYRILEVFSRDAGERKASFSFDLGKPEEDPMRKSEASIAFNCRPAVEVTLEVLDFDGQPTTGQFVIRDQHRRIYPARTRRLEPDFFFHDQIYRHSGESVTLPPGEYEFEYARGPEYRILKRKVIVGTEKKQKESFRLERWAHLAKQGWYSGDHHIHGAGCAHYESPTKGVTPESMMRHILGEDLNIGCVLSWGPCWYAQKEFFDGQVHPLSKSSYVMRYDVEVSGFPSSYAGHLCLLRLTEDDYPGAKTIEEWPTWDLPILQWAKKQGAVVGFAHSGHGLQVPETTLPSYTVPRFDGIGANEYIVDVAHDAVDFISAVNTPIVWELSIWYHTLNCGFDTRISAETDFPCAYDERVGLCRSYVKMPKDKPLDFDNWVQGIKDGRSYASEGRTHLFDFTVNNLGVGESLPGGKPSRLSIKAGEKLTAKVQFLGLLASKPNKEIKGRTLEQGPYWHIERARIGESNRVPVELIVNGKSVETVEVPADGTISEVKFDYVPKESCWLAVRVFAAAHTNPFFVEVDGKPIRASRRSAQWCLDAVDVCWKSKMGILRPTERDAAQAGYEKAREVYRKILGESPAD